MQSAHSSEDDNVVMLKRKNSFPLREIIRIDIVDHDNAVLPQVIIQGGTKSRRKNNNASKFINKFIHLSLLRSKHLSQCYNLINASYQNHIHSNSQTWTIDLHLLQNWEIFPLDKNSTMFARLKYNKIAIRFYVSPPSGGDILFLPCPSVRLSVYPSVRLSVCHTSFPLNNSSTL